MNMQWILMGFFALLALFFLTGCALQDWAIENLCPQQQECPECVMEDAIFWIDGEGGLHGDVGAAWDAIKDD